MARLVNTTALLLCSLLAPSAQAACGTSSEPARVVHVQEQAYNAHDVDAFAACYSDDATLDFLESGHAQVVGTSALKQTYAWLRTAPAGFHVKTLNKIVEGPIVIAHEQLIGGRDNWPKRATVVYEVRHGKIVHAWFPPTK